MNLFIRIALLFILFLRTGLHAQEIREYVVKRSTSTMVIDGQLAEAAWQGAGLTEKFVIYRDGTPTSLSTQAKILWDDRYLYVAFICEDPDVWAEMINRDDYLWNEEVVEIFCDPDGDGLNYIEIEVNPLETVLDLVLDKAYFEGGKADFSWNLDGLEVAVSVDGTINDLDDIDTRWLCEVAIPFQALAFTAPSNNFPPRAGDEWRLLLCRYNYERTGDKVVEISCWNQTDSRGFHVPSKFGRIVFSGDIAVAVNPHQTITSQPVAAVLGQNYPNPFNPSTTIDFIITSPGHVIVTIFDSSAREVVTLVDGQLDRGWHQVRWDGKDKKGDSTTSGVYFLVMRTEEVKLVKKMIRLR
jgi:hypothetical protein